MNYKLLLLAINSISSSKLSDEIKVNLISLVLHNAGYLSRNFDEKFIPTIIKFISKVPYNKYKELLDLVIKIDDLYSDDDEEKEVKLILNLIDQNPDLWKELGINDNNDFYKVTFMEMFLIIANELESKLKKNNKNKLPELIKSGKMNFSHINSIVNKYK